MHGTRMLVGAACCSLAVSLLAAPAPTSAAAPAPPPGPAASATPTAARSTSTPPPPTAEERLPALAAPAPTAARGPASWSNRRLAAQVLLAGVEMDNLAAAKRWARGGVGGMVLFGDPPRRLRAKLRKVRAAGSPAPFIASDEEGGLVQRLADVIYPLPSADWLGRHRTPRQVQKIVRRYGDHMRRLRVTMALAPVADLGIPGYYIEQLHRAFARRPGRTAKYVKAWESGLRAASVVPVVKHWPGHGHARDTHTGAARTPPLSVLERRDMVPFRRAFRTGAPAVMVGHLRVPGLTRRGLPASLSRPALRYLRDQAGPDVLVITDALDMAAATTAVGLTRVQAAVTALRAGADMVLTRGGGSPRRVIAAIGRAIRSERYPRDRAVRSVRRILAVKAMTRLS